MGSRTNIRIVKRHDITPRGQSEILRIPIWSIRLFEVIAILPNPFIMARSTFPPGGSMPYLRAFRLCAFVCLLAIVPSVFSADAAPGANTDPTYQQLRNLTLGSEAVTVNNFTFKRDAATFHLRSGTL